MSKAKKESTEAPKQVPHREDNWLDIKEVAAFCNVTYITVWRWIAKGVGRAPKSIRRLRADWVGGRQKVRQSELEKFLA